MSEVGVWFLNEERWCRWWVSGFSFDGYGRWKVVFVIKIALIGFGIIYFGCGYHEFD